MTGRHSLGRADSTSGGMVRQAGGGGSGAISMASIAEPLSTLLMDLNMISFYQRCLSSGGRERVAHKGSSKIVIYTREENDYQRQE